jgi:hypothetical protein
MPLPREASALPTGKEEAKIIFNDHISIMFLTFGRVIITMWKSMDDGSTEFRKQCSISRCHGKSFLIILLSTA